MGDRLARLRRDAISAPDDDSAMDRYVHELVRTSGGWNEAMAADEPLFAAIQGRYRETLSAEIIKRDISIYVRNAAHILEDIFDVDGVRLWADFDGIMGPVEAFNKKRHADDSRRRSFLSMITIYIRGTWIRAGLLKIIDEIPSGRTLWRVSHPGVNALPGPVQARRMAQIQEAVRKMNLGTEVV